MNMVYFDVYTGRLRVKTVLGDMSLRDFYMHVRKQDKRPTAIIEKTIGISHPHLYSIEHKTPAQKTFNQSPMSILAGLMEMGYEVVIRKKVAE